MTWKNKLQRFLDSEERELEVGRRTPLQIREFRDDVKRWKLPLAVSHEQVVYKGKVMVWVTKVLTNGS